MVPVEEEQKKNVPNCFFFPLLALTFALLSLQHLDLALLCFARAGIGGVRAADRCECLDHGLWGIVRRLWGVSRRRTLRDGLMSRRATGPTGPTGRERVFLNPSSAGSEKHARGACHRFGRRRAAQMGFVDDFNSSKLTPGSRTALDRGGGRMRWEKALKRFLLTSQIFQPGPEKTYVRYT